MFKDKNICGQAEIYVDDKNRIILPMYTGAAAGEELVIVRNKESNCYDIYNAELYFEKLKHQINYLEAKLKTTINLKKREKLQLLLNDIYSCNLGTVTCDKQRRVVITPILEKDEKINKVKTIGAYDHLMIKK